MKEFGKKGAISRRSFLAALGLAGASAAGAGLAGCAPKQPTEAAGDDQTALADTGTLVETDIPEDKIIETVDCRRVRGWPGRGGGRSPAFCR